MPAGVVFNVQRYSVQDGPGIRTTVFLKGCPLDCAWCHNPEGISYRLQTMTLETRCIRCGECIRVCPHTEAVELGSSQAGANVPTSTPLPAASAHQCDLCGACVQACPTGARLIMGTRMSVEEVVTTVLRDRLFYEESGGGVTFSGGEPLAQPAFLKEALAACRFEGIHTVVDTCGYAPLSDLLDIALLTDLFLYDIKILDEAAHLRFTGKPNRIILENLRALAKAHKNIWVRIPVIPGVNDAKQELEPVAEFISSVAGISQVNLLPFHANGAAKAARLGHPVRSATTKAPLSETLEAALAIFSRAGLSARVGG